MQSASGSEVFLTTGNTSLDRFLGGGWRRGRITELVGRPGEGKTTLALGTAARLTRAGDRVALVSPGERLFPPAIRAQGVDLSLLLWVRPKAGENGRWAAKQLVRSGIFPLILAGDLGFGEIEARRLQLAAERSGATILLLNSAHTQADLWAVAGSFLIRRLSSLRFSIRVLKTRNYLESMSTEVSLDEYAHTGHPSPLPAAAGASSRAGV